MDKALGVAERKYLCSSLVLKILKSGRDWDWSKTGDFRGYSGQGGAKQICDMVVSELRDNSGFSVKDLAQKIMAD